MELDIKKLSKAIRKLRKQKGINQYVLGEMIGVKKSQICKIETNPQDMKFSTIMRIVKALDMELVLTSEGLTIKSVI